MGGCKAKEGAACEAQLEGDIATPAIDGQAAAIGQSAELLNAVSGVSGHIVGHASPVWAAGGGDTKNAALSRRRAANTSQALELLLKEGSAAGLMTVDVGLSSEDHPVGELSTEGAGDQETLQEADGDVESDDPQLRRTEISLTVRHQVQGEAPSSENVATEAVRPAFCRKDESSRWGLRAYGGAGASVKIGVGVGVMMGELMNWRTGESMVGIFSGVGLGFGTMTPSASAPDWTNFTTREFLTFADFEGTPMAVYALSAGLLVLSGSAICDVIFPKLSDESIDLSGFSTGGAGIDFSTNFGTWMFANKIPEPKCYPERTTTQDAGVEASTIYTYEIETAHRHVLYFGTGVDILNDEALLSLRAFVQDCLSTPQAGATP